MNDEYENTTQETEVVKLPPVPAVTVMEDGRLHCKCFNEHVDVLARLADFGISYTKSCREQLQLIWALHKKFFSLHQKKDSNVDVSMDLFTKVKDIEDPGSPVEEIEFIYRVQNNKTKVVLEISHNTKDNKQFGTDCYKVAQAGDATDGKWKTVFMQDTIPIKKELDETIDEIYNVYTKYQKKEDVEKQVDDVPLADL